LAAIQFVVMLTMLLLFTNFHYEKYENTAIDRMSPRTRNISGLPRLMVSFDSSGWFYMYHFGVAQYMSDHVLRHGSHSLEEVGFSGSSGGSLVAATICSGVDVNKMSAYVVSCRDACKYNPWMMLPSADKAIETYLPPEAHITLSNRVRILLTRVSFMPPFIMAEIPSKFKSREHLKMALRASCHVPGIGGVLPYWFDGAGYFDGMFWSNALAVPWRYFHPEDELIKVSAFGTAGSQIYPGSSSNNTPMPPWWAIFPPAEEVLEGMMEQGYRDAANYFSNWESTGKNPQIHEMSRKMKLPKDSEKEASAAKYGHPELESKVQAFHRAAFEQWMWTAIFVALWILIGAVAASTYDLTEVSPRPLHLPLYPDQTHI